MLKELRQQGLDDGAIGLIESKLSENTGDGGYCCLRLRFDQHGQLVGVAMRKPPTERALELRAAKLAKRSAG